MIAAARRIWLGTLCVALMIVCIACGAAIRSAAETPEPGHLQIALPGIGHGFTDSPTGSLFDTERLAPGVAVRGVMGVRNSSGGPADLSATMTDLREVDRCADGASSCSHGRDGMIKLLSFTVETSDDKAHYASVWSGTASGVIRGIPIGRAIASGAERWVRMTITLPASAGNGTEYEGIRFGLRIALDAGVLGVSTMNVGGHHTQGVRVAGLAITGTQLTMLGTVALTLLLIGMAITVLGRRRVPRHSDRFLEEH